MISLCAKYTKTEALSRRAPYTKYVIHNLTKVSVQLYTVPFQRSKINSIWKKRKHRCCVIETEFFTISKIIFEDENIPTSKRLKRWSKKRMWSNYLGTDFNLISERFNKLSLVKMSLNRDTVALIPSKIYK